MESLILIRMIHEFFLESRMENYYLWGAGLVLDKRNTVEQFLGFWTKLQSAKQFFKFNKFSFGFLFVRKKSSQNHISLKQIIEKKVDLK